MSTVPTIASEVLSLPPHDRLKLAVQLIDAECGKCASTARAIVLGVARELELACAMKRMGEAGRGK